MVRKRLQLLVVAALAIIFGLHYVHTSIGIRQAFDNAKAQSLLGSLATNVRLDETIRDAAAQIQVLPQDNHTRILVVPALKKSNVSWFDGELPGIEKVIYIADDRSAKYHPPKNKGNEVMVYLTYIIDHYDTLPDISIFLHPHRRSWHNNDLLENDAAEMITRLNNARVMREGYMNLRCQWDPGCPHWLHPRNPEQAVMRKQEQFVIAKAWKELFPGETLPETLSNACCAQFAVSRKALTGLPIHRYVWFRDWLMRTELSDYLAGRVFEYIWQYIFTSKYEVCPSQHVCYCDGYGVCFPGPEAFQKWFELRWRMTENHKKLKKWMHMDDEFNESVTNGTYDTLPHDERPQRPEAGIDDKLRDEIGDIMRQMSDQKEIALRRGMDPRIRAQESGREWQEGDGF
jgi:hypothetical protein